jgi:hypothetical protein
MDPPSVGLQKISSPVHKNWIQSSPLSLKTMMYSMIFVAFLNAHANQLTVHQENMYQLTIPQTIDQTPNAPPPTLDPQFSDVLSGVSMAINASNASNTSSDSTSTKTQAASFLKRLMS